MHQKKLSIIFLDFDDVKNPLLNGGQARATYEVGKRFVARGHKFTVISSRYPGSVNRIEAGIHYRHIGLGSHHIRLNNIFYIFCLPFVVSQLSADILIECFTAPVSTLFTPLYTRIPVVAIPTCFDAARFTRLYHLPFQWIERFGSRFYRYFLPYTPADAQKMRHYNPTVSSRIVAEGVADEFFSIKRRPGKYFLFLGRFDMYQKGLDLLLDAYALKQHELRYPLIIAGCGPDESRIRKRVAQLHLSGRVTLVGSAYGAKKRRLLSQALFVAFPSRSEGFSLFSLEALASGVPLVSFDIPALAWIPKSISCKTTPKSAPEYGQCLIEAQTRFTSAKIASQCRKVAGRYSWDRVCNEFEIFFTLVLRCEARRFQQGFSIFASVKQFFKNLATI